MYKTLTSISGFAAGETVPAGKLTDKQAERLLALGAIEKAKGRPRLDAEEVGETVPAAKKTK